MAHHAVKQPACANCQYAFPPGEPDEFCPRCGQQNHAVNLSFGHVVEESLEGVFHFDSKVFRTLGLLLFRPGQLTKQFLAGHRMPYVPPMRLYVFISFLFFFLISLQGGHGGRKPLREEITENQREAAATGAVGKVEVMPGVTLNPPPNSATLRRATAELRKRARRGDKQAAEKLARLTEAEQVLAGQLPGSRAAAADSLADDKDDKNDKERTLVLGFDVERIDFSRLPANLSSAQVDSVIRSTGEEPGLASRLAVKRAARWRDVTRDELFRQALRGASILMFLLMPLAALLLKGVYFRQHRYYISHLIFTVHMHCFAFILITLVSAASRVPVLDNLTWLLQLAGVGYFVVALRTVYEQGWGRTIVKSLLLGTSYVMVLGLSVVAVFVLGALIF